MLKALSMQDSLRALINRVENGTIEDRIQALDDFRRSFDELLAAVVRAMQRQDPFALIERVAFFSDSVRKAFLPAFNDAASEDTKLELGLALLYCGHREAVPWLLHTARNPGPYQYTATVQLAFRGVVEVKPMILEQLRAVPLSASLPLASSDIPSGLLHAWAQLGEPLPADLRTKLTGDDMPLGVKVAMKSLKL